MAINRDDFLVEYRAMLERSIREQVERHQNVNPAADPRRAVAIQMQQERSRLEALLEEEETTPDQAAIFRSLIEWLPQLERNIIGR